MIQEYGTAKRSGLRFEPIAASALRRVSVVPQCLDNQWVPSRALSNVMRKRKRWFFPSRASRVLDDDKFAAYVRTEYIRSLIAAEQVIVNRAYLFCSEPLFRDYIAQASHREAFKTLIESRAIVTFLYREENPAGDLEERLNGRGEGFSFDRDGAEAWLSICSETTPTCIRLDWDGQKNLALTEQMLQRPFHNRLRQLDTGDPMRFLSELRSGEKIDAGEAKSFGRHLRDVTQFIERVRDKEGRLSAREDIYKKFVVASNTKPAERIVDGGKPFMAETKQLADLIYNTNLTDALRILTLTPQDSPSRTTLQEDRRLGADPELSGEALANVLRDIKFATLSQALRFVDFGRLTLDDVVAIRATEAWHRYIAAVENMLRDPNLPEDKQFVSAQLAGVANLSAAYGALLQEISLRYADRVLHVTGGHYAVQIAVRAGAHLLTATLLPNQSLVSSFLTGEVVSRPVEAVTRVALGWLKERGGELVHAVSYELSRCRFQSAQTEIDALLRGLVAHGFSDISTASRENEMEPSSFNNNEEFVPA